MIELKKLVKETIYRLIFQGPDTKVYSIIVPKLIC